MDVLYRLSYIGNYSLLITRAACAADSGSGPDITHGDASAQVSGWGRESTKKSRCELRLQGAFFVNLRALPPRTGAEDEARTRYPQLGRLMLYQMSYFRLCRLSGTPLCRNERTGTRCQRTWWGEKDSNLRTPKRTDLQSVAVGHLAISPVGGQPLTEQSFPGSRRICLACH
jgi:hypothetical protein